jgi:hypothetical protein
VEDAEAHTLKNLNLTGDQIDKLKTVPYTALIAAGVAALRSAAQELGRPALNWDVIADDQYVTAIGPTPFRSWPARYSARCRARSPAAMAARTSGHRKRSPTS